MRIFVYVNINPIQRHMMIHCENKKTCSHIMQHILTRNIPSASTVEDVSEDRDKSVIKLGETKNSFWLLINVSECLNIVDKVKKIKVISDFLEKYPSTSINVHEECSI